MLVVFTLTGGRVEDINGQYDTSYAMITPLGTTGGHHMMVILKNEGNDDMPSIAAGTRCKHNYRVDTIVGIQNFLPSSPVCIIIG